MTCQRPVGCGHEFCWLCLADYTSGHFNGLGSCRQFGGSRGSGGEVSGRQDVISQVLHPSGHPFWGCCVLALAVLRTDLLPLAKPVHGLLHSLFFGATFFAALALSSLGRLWPSGRLCLLAKSLYILLSLSLVALWPMLYSVLHRGDEVDFWIPLVFFVVLEIVMKQIFRTWPDFSARVFCVGFAAVNVCLWSVVGLHHLEKGLCPSSTFNFWCSLYRMFWVGVMLMLCVFILALFLTVPEVDDGNPWSAQNYGISAYIVAHFMAALACLLSLAVCWGLGIADDFYMWMIPISLGMLLLHGFLRNRDGEGSFLAWIVLQVLFFQWLCMFGSDSDAAYFFAYALPAIAYWEKWNQAWRPSTLCGRMALIAFPSVMATLWWIRHYTPCLIVQQIFGCAVLLYIIGRSAKLIWVPVLMDRLVW